jgi:Mn-dependent DtxR family transcriptional regulator
MDHNFVIHWFSEKGEKMATAKKSGKKNVSLEKFIEAYQNESLSKVSDVAAFLGVKPSAVSIRANKLKKGGIELRTFARGRESNILEKAKKILENLNRKK